MENYQPGTLVRVRDRDWVVMPSEDEQLIRIKPLGGSEEEETGIFLPLAFDEDKIHPAEFPYPTIDDMGSFESARLLYNAARLSFRNGAGPFRSLAKYSFRPRSYQMVPLIMALKQETIRLLIADDVGVGKTIEALMVVNEFLERRIIKRFAVICLPHLCDQWQQEIKDKFDIDAVIIRSSTQAQLDREIQGDESVYTYYPYQIISIDYIKSDVRREVFINECPELVVVDEAHTCTKADGATSTAQQQRHKLIKDISMKNDQHLVLLTATPHSGKPTQFQSLLGLLNERYNTFDITTSSQNERRELAKSFVQRKRADVEQWMNEGTTFPERDAGEFPYELSMAYAMFYDRILDFAHGLTKDKSGHRGHQRLKYWTALALLRGVMSSPRAGVEMLNNRIKNTLSDEELELMQDSDNPLIDEDYGQDNDVSPTGIIQKTDLKDSQTRQLRELSKELETLSNLADDTKLATTLDVVKKWLKEGYNPVIFCRYIGTANYVGELLKPQLESRFKGVNVQVITSEDPDEVRKERIEAMEPTKMRVLVATDCLSEGINLQKYFTAVLHYDLPWNPNRLEQREGRGDRFGQPKEKVKAYLLYGKDNPIDGTVLKVILKKVREIKKDTGISMPFPEDSKTIMDAVLHAVLLNPKRIQKSLQTTMDFGDEDVLKEKEVAAEHAIQSAADREKRSRTIFAQNAIKPEEIETDLREVDEAIGNMQAVEEFLTQAMAMLGVQMIANKKGYTLYTTNLPEILKDSLPGREEVRISFNSPTPDGFTYIGRNHAFVEQLCQLLLASAFTENGTENKLARSSVIRSIMVTEKTTIILFRVRNVIEDQKKINQLIAEEMLVWGYQGTAGDRRFLPTSEAQALLKEVKPAGSITNEQRNFLLNHELGNLDSIKDDFDKIAEARAGKLVESHERFRKVIGGNKYQVVYPVLPMDVMGIYIVLPS
jgi:superfamily II DNA or RNA helicase